MKDFVDTVIALIVAIISMVTSAIAQIIPRILIGRQKVAPHLYYKEGELNQFVKENCPSLLNGFCPPWWMVNKHAQTMLPSILPNAEIDYHRDIVQLNDGGVLAIDWAKNGSENLSETAPVVVIFPGLGGDADGYKQLSKFAIERGLRPVVFNKRGHGGCKVTTPKLQSFGDTADVRQVMDYINLKYPDAPLTSVGVSAGSSLLASYLGEEKEKSQFLTGAIICPGYQTFKLFRDHLCAPYNYLLLRGLKRIIQDSKDVLSKRMDLTSSLASTTVSELEERLYCKMYGFKTLADYWAKNDPMRDAWDISVPLLGISSRDDPVCQECLIPYYLFTDKDNGILAVTDQGGHCGFVEEGTLTSWAEKAAIDYIVTVLKFLEMKKSKISNGST